MAGLRLMFLDKSEEELVHAETLRCLEEIGVKVHSPSVLKTLSDFGARVDLKAGVARLPEGVVNEALEKAPKQITLHARDPKHDLRLPTEGAPYICTTGLAVYVIDLDTGERRPSTRKDIADFGRLSDALKQLSYFWPTVTATDVKEDAHSLHELWTSFQNCTKHVQGVSIIDAEDAKAQIELGACIAGGKDALKKRPLFSVISCPVAPLSFERGAIEGQAELARGGIPVVSMSMSLSGMSSPVTLAGTIVNANAENLASLTITQASAPGAPHIYSSESAPIDMATGGISYYAPESGAISAAMGQMARRYRLPNMVGAWGVGGMEPGIPEEFSEVMGGVLYSLSGTDLAAGMGSLDSAKGASLAQVVLDAWLWEDVLPFIRKFRVDEDTIPLEVMKAVGHGGTFLTHPHTQRNFRKELYVRPKDWKSWQRYPSGLMVADAITTAKRALKEHVVPKLEPEVAEQGDRIIKAYESRLSP